MIQRFKAQSTNIKEVMYGTESNVLQVTFQNGTVYRYLAVPEKVFKQFKDASSAGTYFHKAIKDRFKSRKIS